MKARKISPTSDEQFLSNESRVILHQFPTCRTSTFLVPRPEAILPEGMAAEGHTVDLVVSADRTFEPSFQRLQSCFKFPILQNH